MTRYRDPEATREALLGAGVRVLERHYKSQTGDRPPLPITVAEVLKEVREQPWPDGSEPRELTTGAVTQTFGTRVQMMEEIAGRMISPSSLIGELKEFVEHLKEVLDDTSSSRSDLAVHDALNSIGTISATRHWLAAHSQAANESIRQQLREVYRGFDELLIPLYKKIGDLEGREPRAGLTWAHVASALTAWTEGLMLRSHYEDDASQPSRPWNSLAEAKSMIAMGADGLWSVLTQPVSDAE